MLIIATVKEALKKMCDWFDLIASHQSVAIPNVPNGDLFAEIEILKETIEVRDQTIRGLQDENKALKEEIELLKRC